MNKETGEVKRAFSGDRRRMAITALIGVAVLLSTVFAGLVMDTNTGQSRLDSGLTPRNLDIWAIYPDQTVRFVTLIEPDDAGKVPSTVDAAGPLVRSGEDILKAGIIGGTSTQTQLLSGADYFNSPEAQIYYPAYWLDYDGKGVYGVDVFVKDSPYIAPDPEDPAGETMILTLGTNPEESYQQIVVAVALPRGARVVELSGIYPYRQVKLGGWNILYYDTSSPSYGAMIRVRFILDPEETMRDFNLARVDSKR